jgi:hypothetical protein
MVSSFISSCVGVRGPAGLLELPVNSQQSTVCIVCSLLQSEALRNVWCSYRALAAPSLGLSQPCQVSRAWQMHCGWQEHAAGCLQPAVGLVV